MLNHNGAGRTLCYFPAESMSPIKQISETKRVLGADTPEGVEMLRDTLEETIQVVAATSLVEALKVLRSEIDLALCGTHFDEWRMLELLRLAKSDPETRNKPVLCYRDLNRELRSGTFKRLKFMCIALGAVGFIDLYSLKKQFGTEQANIQFKRTVLRYLKD